MAPNRIFYRVNYGFRSLIDWANVQSVSGPLDPGSRRGSADTTEVVHRNPGSNLKGPYQYSSEGGRPLEDQLTDRRKIPGHHGAYWDIMYWNKPSLKYGKGSQSKDEYLRGLDVHAQQWIYLAAEKAGAIMAQVKDEKMEGKTSEQKAALEEEYNNLLRFFASDDEALSAMGVSLSKNTFPVNFDEQLGQIKELTYRSKARVDSPWGGAAGIGPVSGRGKGATTLDKPTFWEYKKEGSSYKRVDEWDPLKRHYYSMGQMEEAPMQLRKMMAGLTSGKSWINAFSRSMDEKGVPYMNKLAKYVDEYINKETNAIANRLGLKPGGRVMTGAIKGLEKGRVIEVKEYEEGMSAGGPVQERASVAAGAAVSPSDAIEGNVSKPIDIKFVKEAAVNIGKLKGVRDFDLTKSLYGGKGPVGQHGTIPNFKVSQFDNYASLNIEGIENLIREQYKNDRLPTYNHIIKIILAGTGKKTMKEAREQIRGKGPSQKKAFEDKWGTGSSKHGAGQVYQMALDANNAILKGSSDFVTDMSRADLFHTLQWVLHHMGQELIPETYGNMMGIELPDKTTGTLLIGFQTDDKGFYIDVDVVILDDLTPIEWLYEQALKVNADLTFDAFLEGGNLGLATIGLEGTIQIGALAKFANLIKANGFIPRISMGRLSESKFSKHLERVMEAVFGMMGENISKQLNNQIKQEAVKFSKAARDPSQLGATQGWFKYAWKMMLDRDTAPSLGNDPFWYLWAAPYVSGEVAREGGSVQEQAAGAKKY